MQRTEIRDIIAARQRQGRRRPRSQMCQMSRKIYYVCLVAAVLMWLSYVTTTVFEEPPSWADAFYCMVVSHKIIFLIFPFLVVVAGFFFWRHGNYNLRRQVANIEAQIAHIEGLALRQIADIERRDQETLRYRRNRRWVRRFRAGAGRMGAGAGRISQNIADFLEPMGTIAKAIAAVLALLGFAAAI